MKKILIFSIFLLAALEAAEPLPLLITASRVASDAIEEHFSTFSFRLSNFKEKERYELSLKDIRGKEELLHSDLRLGPDGTLIEKDGSSFTLCPLSMGLGEPLLLTCRSKHRSAHCFLVPRPFTLSSNGYVLNIELKDPEGKTFSLCATGFEPGEKIQLFSQSGDRVIRQNLLANQRGEISGTLSHNYPNRGGGRASLEISAKKGKCELCYPWGLEYDKEMCMHRVEEKRDLHALADSAY